MKASEFTELRFIADAIVGAPERLRETVGRVIDDRDTPESVKQAVARIRALVNESDYSEVETKLLHAAEELLLSADQFDQHAGSALYSALLNSKAIERLRIHEALRTTHTNRLLERYRAAAGFASGPRTPTLHRRGPR